MEKILLNNQLPLILKNNKNTPRIALCLSLSIGKQEKNAGELSLIKSLLFQGTKTKNGEQLAALMENNGIDCYVSSSKDYICFKLVCLNEDFKLGLEILNDIVFNSTFEEFEKERTKIKGEFLSDLDSPQLKAFDEFTKAIFANHPYGNSRSKILAEIDNIEKNDIIEFYNYILNNSRKSIAVVGDFDKIGSKDTVIQLVNDNFASLTNSEFVSNISIPQLSGKRLVTKVKPDSAQAQIIQGWLFPSLNSEEYPAIVTMNTILGASGLSSRLFQELREKKGLAYTVRSSYDSFKQCGCLWVYIGTNPVNMQVAIDGFKSEIEKMKTDFVSDEELLGGKNNILGKRQFILETNIQQAFSMSFYELMGCGFDFENVFEKRVLETKKEDIKAVANKYFTNNFVLCALAPQVNIKM